MSYINNKEFLKNQKELILIKKSRILGKMVLAFVLCCSMCVGVASAANPDKVYNINGTTITFGSMEREIIPLSQRESLYFKTAHGQYRKFTTPKISANPNGGSHVSVEVENIGNNPIDVSCTVTVDGTTLTETKVVYSNSPTLWYGFDINNPNGAPNCSFIITVEPHVSGQAIDYSITAYQD